MKKHKHNFKFKSTIDDDADRGIYHCKCGKEIYKIIPRKEIKKIVKEAMKFIERLEK